MSRPLGTTDIEARVAVCAAILLAIVIAARGVSPALRSLLP